MLAQILGRTPRLLQPGRVQGNFGRLINPLRVALGFPMAQENKAPGARPQRPLCSKAPHLIQTVLGEPGLPNLRCLVRCHVID